MQTKKKMPGRNSAREHANPRVSRSQKKVSETVQIKEQKVTEIIASSTRKQRFGKLKPSSYLGYGCGEVSLSSFAFLCWYCILL